MTPSVRSLVIVGAGGHGREVLGVVHRTAKYDFAGFIDDGCVDSEVLSRVGARHLGGVDAMRSVSDLGYVIGIGSGLARRILASQIPGSWFAPNLVDPSATFYGDVRLSTGCVIFTGATVTTNISVGAHTHVGRGAAIGHDCEIGDFVTIMPLASVSGGVVIGDCATVGAGAVIRQGQSIGANSFVGAGAVVVCDVPEGVTVVGNPARPIVRGGPQAN